MQTASDWCLCPSDTSDPSLLSGTTNMMCQIHLTLSLTQPWNHTFLFKKSLILYGEKQCKNQDLSTSVSILLLGVTASRASQGGRARKEERDVYVCVCMYTHTHPCYEFTELCIQVNTSAEFLSILPYYCVCSSLVVRNLTSITYSIFINVLSPRIHIKSF